MNNPPSVEKMFSSGSFEDDLYGNALGWKTPELFIISRAVVISVKLGPEISDAAASTFPQFSINARVIGEDSSSVTPENEVPRWFYPLMPNAIFAVPEIGEQILVIRETTKLNSRGYWIGRINDTDDVSLKLTNNHSVQTNPSPTARYGMPFDVQKVNSRSEQPSAANGSKMMQIPASLGDVVVQGRSGSYLRNSYNPLYNQKPGVLEMGILESRVYRPSGLPTLGSTKTKTVHLADTVPIDISQSLEKESVDVESSDKRNFILNISDETYNFSRATDAESKMHRLVLGEKLNKYFEDQNFLIQGLINVSKSLVTTLDDLFNSYVDHEHALPEINIDIPDKEVVDKQVVNRGIRFVPQPAKRVFVPATRVRVPGSGDVFQTVTETPANGPPVRTRKLVARGTPGATVTIPSKFITVPSPPKAVNLGYRTVVKKRRIKFDDISIGGAANPRFTVPIETDEKTEKVQQNVNNILSRFDKTKQQFSSLLTQLENNLSKRHFIN